MLLKNTKWFLLFFLVLFVAGVAFACTCNATNPSISSPSLNAFGRCYVNVNVTCSCGNCVDAVSSGYGDCVNISGCGHSDNYCTMRCVGSDNSVHVLIYGGTNTNTLQYNNTFSCCTPSSQYSPYCGQSLGCGTYNSTTDVQDWKNSCDRSDLCGNTRSTGLFNSCDLTTNTSCRPNGVTGEVVNASVNQCDGVDNDCDGVVDSDNIANNGILDCKKNDYNSGVDCTPTCTTCKDNKVSSIVFKSLTNDSTTTVKNSLTGDNSFSVDINAVSPNSCLTGYNIELQYKTPSGSWQRVQPNVGMGINNFALSTAQANFSSDASITPLKRYYFGNALTDFSQKLSFASGDSCTTSLDCNQENNEVCDSNNQCSVYNYDYSCVANSIVGKITKVCDENGVCVPDGNELYSSVCSVGTTCSDANCSPSQTNVCSERSNNTVLTLDQNGGILKETNCASGEICSSGACVARSSQCQVANIFGCSLDKNKIIKYDSCLNVTNSDYNNCSLLTPKSSCFQIDQNNASCCYPTNTNVCGADGNLYTTNSCGINTLKQVCDSTQQCNAVAGNCCTKDATQVCSADRNQIIYHDSCGGVSRVENCASGKLCTDGYCQTQYSVVDGNGFKVINSSNKNIHFTFDAKYLPVGYTYRIRAQVTDSKSARNVSGASYADNNWFVSNEIIVENTIPSTPSVEYIDRFENSTILRTRISTSIDPDIFISPYNGSQSLNYFARLFEESLKANPGSYGSSTVKGDFNTADINREIEIPLVNERTYCSEGRSFDGVNYSAVSDQFCGTGYETPFQPQCSDLGLNVSIAQIVELNQAENKIDVNYRFSCDKSPFMNEDWNVLVTKLAFYDAQGNIINENNITSINDCNLTPIIVPVTLGTTDVGVYTARINYGGVYNAIPLDCTVSQNIIVNEGGSGNTGSSIGAILNENTISKVTNEKSIPDNNVILVIIVGLFSAFILLQKSKK